MQAYSNPKRESDPYSLPDVEVFYADREAVIEPDGMFRSDLEEYCGQRFTMDDIDGYVGYYWWICFPGCLPDSDPAGPFDTESAALEDVHNVTGEDLS